MAAGLGHIQDLLHTGKRSFRCLCMCMYVCVYVCICVCVCVCVCICVCAVCYVSIYGCTLTYIYKSFLFVFLYIYHLEFLFDSQRFSVLRQVHLTLDSISAWIRYGARGRKWVGGGMMRDAREH